MALRNGYRSARSRHSLRLAQNVQRTCMNLRQLLKQPEPGAYGTITIVVPDSTGWWMLSFQRLSQWLHMRASGDMLTSLEQLFLLSLL